jgi:hypothetical protein
MLKDNQQHLRDYLQFKVYKVGHYFYHRIIAKRFYKNELDEKVYKLNSKLQYRWTGPFRILEKINAVLNKADIYSKSTMVHTINMQPF